MNARIGSAVVTASILFTGVVGSLVARTPQDNPANQIGPQTPMQRARAAHNSTLTQLPPKLASVTPRDASAPQEVANDSTAAGTFVTFEVPGAGAGSRQGTLASAINAFGEIVGYYNDANTAGHGFLRSPDGTLHTFDAPGAGIGSGQGTFPEAINDAGVVTGYYCEATVNFVCPGFVRGWDGKVTAFDVPGDVNGTYPYAIDIEGTVTGIWLDINYEAHGFVRSPFGKITTFDAPDTGTGFFLPGTFATAINPEGTVSGCYTADASGPGGPSYGFIRDADGALTTFDVPGPLLGECGYGAAGFAGFPNAGFGINPFGTTTGTYFETLPASTGNSFGGNNRGYVRFRDGTYTGFDAVPNPNSPCCTWTYGVAINPEGAIAGLENDYDGVNHGFLRSPDGIITLLDAPGAGIDLGQGTLPSSINLLGWITGSYVDAAYAWHGFLWIP